MARAPKASQVQYGSSKKRPRAVSASASVDDEAEGSDQEDEVQLDGKGKKKETSEETMRAIGMDLVRLALFQEGKKAGLNKKDIQQKILTDKHKVSTRQLPQALEAAQKVLRKTFGMELVALRKAGKAGDGSEDDMPAPSKKNKGKARADDEQEVEEAEEAAGKGKKKGTSSDMYILRSLIPAELLTYALDPDPAAVLRLGPGGQSSGAIVDFQVGDDPKLMGVLWLILSLILINGRELEENLLKSQLRRLSISSTSALPTSHPSHHTPALTLEPFLSYLKQHKYLETVRPSAATQVAEGQGQTVWRWGARSDAEIGEKDLADMIAEMIKPGGRDEDAEVEESVKERQEREKKEGAARERVKRDVAAAAGMGAEKLRER